MEHFHGLKSILSEVYTRIRSAAGITIVLSIVIAILAAVDKGPYIIMNTIVTGGMWALMAMGLALLFGVMNLANFAHGDFFMIGALTAYFVTTFLAKYASSHSNTLLLTVAPLVTIFAATIAGALLGVACELIVFRPLRKRSREQWVMNVFILTLGVSVILTNGHQLLLGVGFKGIVGYWNLPAVSIFQTFISWDRIFVFLVGTVALSGFWVFMRFTRSGRAIRAVSQDEAGALTVGIDLNRIQILTLAVSCALASLAGGCLLFMYPAYPTMGVGPLYNSWFVVIVVGMGNVGAAVIGGFIVALFQVLTTVYIGEGWGFVVPSALIIIILLVKPTGIFGSPVRGILEQ
jgi:branched-chain amino acid transport system permease protein